METVLQANHRFDADHFLAKTGSVRSFTMLRKGANIYTQGDEADSLFYVREGDLILSAVTMLGKQATIALLGQGDFVGEECLSTVRRTRLTTATTLTDVLLLKIPRSEMIRVLRDERDVATMFVSYLLERADRIQTDLIDQLSNSSEMRLARLLLLLSNFGSSDGSERLVPPISQDVLATMVGCTRSRVNVFMNSFRRLGYIEYENHIQIRVKRGLLKVLLK